MVDPRSSEDRSARVSLASYDNAWYSPGANPLVRTLWYYVNAVIFASSLVPIVSIKARLLRLFGARVGKGVVIKPSVNIKYPWRLEIGDHVWIGEHVWIDNLGDVVIDSDACISQGALLLCGNHDYTKSSFDLIVEPIRVGRGAWIGARSVVGPGVTVQEHAVLSAGSVASRDLEAGGVYRGNPASRVRDRFVARGG